MDPATIALVSMGASAASGGVGFMSNLAKGKSDSQMYQYQAGVAQFNQKIAEQNRDYAFAAGELEAGRYGLKARQTAGSIKAAQGASGVSINTGSAVDVQESAHDIALMDMGTIRNNAARTAYGYSAQATKYGSEAEAYQYAAKNSKKAGMINAFGSLLGSVSSVSSKWLQAKDAGIFGKTNSDWVTDPNAG